MSPRKQPASITRTYKPAEDDCIRAVELLLKAPASKKEDSRLLTVPDDMRGESRHDSHADTESIPR